MFVGHSVTSFGDVKVEQRSSVSVLCFLTATVTVASWPVCCLTSTQHRDKSAAVATIVEEAQEGRADCFW